MTKIETYWQHFAAKHDLATELPEAWMFGDGSPEMADELGHLVVKGIKSGTCSAFPLYKLEGEEIPQVGQYEIILDGRNLPLAIIQTTKVEILPMNQVSEEFARSEGEGDLSYRYWYDAHEAFFRQALREFDLEFTPELLLVCQNFQVVG
ncbi:ASCH domain-containing protein [Enterococcus sp. LJL90]